MAGDVHVAPLRTDRLDIRRLALQDADCFHAVWGDPDVIFWGASPDVASSRERLRGFLGRRIDGIGESGWFAVIRRADGTFIGDVVLEPASWNAQIAEIGWHIAAAHQSKGYATEAASALVAHARSHGIEEVWAKILPDNVPSQRVALRLGMRRVGTLEHSFRDHDLWFMALGASATRGDFDR